ncbi:Bacitracin resistance protein BacA [Gluconacetobacter diazotrophicus PA1 5]|nr:undecaprenyl-diphosphate phosphatase [Gluconacetobacter diazotrophicus]ACI49822.1 Bacitracin resistance protein BacA [Gluconacetobacter diazotrophicus PA1 5]MBB2155852.1 undecaprenyl-diphosphate phosphatase [Gluconacetobacter diazotrophicus]TWB10329.1 undecaprenyl-diphosphatase [Gluconacetobacter diazotrophicus]
MTLIQAIVIAILQGATELFPVSSLGHAVIVPALLGWAFDPHGEIFLPFLVMLHLGTAIALLVYFRNDWAAIFQGLRGRDGSQRQAESIHILALLVVATIPAVIIGGLLEHWLRALFGTARYAAIFLFLNGLLLLLTERMKSRQPVQGGYAIASLTYADAAIIGLWQCLAFLPGISRSGATIIGALFRGLNHEGAARFSFLMAQPVIIAATVREALHMRHVAIPPGQMQVATIGAMVAAVTALASTAFLMRYFHNHERWALSPFGYYCVLAGAVSFFILGH